MNYRTVCVCAVFALAVAMASAQTKTSLSGKCGKADVQQSIPAGDQAGHAFTLAQGKCTAMGDVGGAAGKEGAFSEHGDVTATHMKNWGVFVETFDSGDKIIYNYQGTGTMKDGAFQAGSEQVPDCRRHRENERDQRLRHLQAHRKSRWRPGLLVQRRIHNAVSRPLRHQCLPTDLCGGSEAA